jgi:3-oxoacyl-[acyl-carrier-protein] synthase-1
MCTSVGVGAGKTAAAVRAGLPRFRESPFYDRRGEPIILAAVPDEDLPPLDPALAHDGGIGAREAQMLRLAGPALAEALEGASAVERLPLFLSLPEALAGTSPPMGPAFLRRLAAQSALRFAVDESRVFPAGRAAGVGLLGEALDRLRTRGGLVLVGGVDSHQDADLLQALDEEDRVRAHGVYDGFTPGEGAAFLLLCPAGASKREHPPMARIHAVAKADEPGHRGSPQPYRGEGLDAAFRGVFERAAGGSGDPVRTVYAGLNGEGFGAKEWGVAFLRHRERFAEGFSLEHPADTLGDAGAALGSLLLGLSTVGIARGYRRSPRLVWCSSDGPARAAALVSASSLGAVGS